MSTYIQSVSAKSKFTSAREGIQARKVSMQDRSAGIDIQGRREDARVGLDVFHAPCTIEKLVSCASPVLPWHRRSSYEPDAPARGVPQSPRWRVGLVCAKDAKLSCRGNSPQFPRKFW